MSKKRIWTGKGAGKKIAIKFDKALIGDVSGLTPAPIGAIMAKPVGIATASGQHSSSYTPDKAFDGSTSSQWYIRTTGDQWIQIELADPAMTNGFRWYIGSSYRPNAFTVQGSSDGETWTTLCTDSSPNQTGWHTFAWNWAGPYKFYRWTITSRHSTYLYVYEIELSMAVGNEAAFIVTGMEKDPLFYGTPAEREYIVNKVERHPPWKVWQDDFSGAMDDVEENIDGLILEPADETEYKIKGTYTLTLPTAQIPDPAPRLRFTVTTPDDTSITVEYAFSDDDETEPDDWAEAENGDILDLEEDYLWLRATLETNDDTVTPILEALWLEEAEPPKDAILLTMRETSRFNDTNGGLTVTYSRATGTLTGGRPVEDFEESFTPTGLEPTPVQEHTITITGGLVLDFVKVSYEPIEHDHTITVTGILAIGLINVEDIVT